VILDGHFAKALALGADAIAVSNAAIQAVGCLAMRACHTNNCPVGIATQKKDLRARLLIEESAQRLTRSLTASTELMKVLCRACGHQRLGDFRQHDLTTWRRDMSDLTGIRFAGVECEGSQWVSA
jgi:glutamate synthase domain-containing protein 2